MRLPQYRPFEYQGGDHRPEDLRQSSGRCGLQLGKDGLQPAFEPVQLARDLARLKREASQKNNFQDSTHEPSNRTTRDAYLRNESACEELAVSDDAEACG